MDAGAHHRRPQHLPCHRFHPDQPVRRHCRRLITLVALVSTPCSVAARTPQQRWTRATTLTACTGPSSIMSAGWAPGQRSFIGRRTLRTLDAHRHGRALREVADPLSGLESYHPRMSLDAGAATCRCHRRARITAASVRPGCLLKTQLQGGDRSPTFHLTTWHTSINRWN